MIDSRPETLEHRREYSVQPVEVAPGPAAGAAGESVALLRLLLAPLLHQQAEGGAPGPVVIVALARQRAWFDAKVLHSMQGTLVETNMFADVLRRNLHVQFWRCILNKGISMVKRNLSIYGVHPTML